MPYLISLVTRLGTLTYSTRYLAQFRWQLWIGGGRFISSFAYGENSFFFCLRLLNLRKLSVTFLASSFYTPSSVSNLSDRYTIWYPINVTSEQINLSVSASLSVHSSQYENKHYAALVRLRKRKKIVEVRTYQRFEL